MGSIFGNSEAKQRYIPKVVKHEENLQMQVCRYLDIKYPNVIYRSDYASGLKLTRNQAVKHKRMQSSRSFPDLFIYQPMQHPNKFYCGLAIELKKEGTIIILKTGPRKGRLSSDKHIQEQAVMLKELNRVGYYANFAVGYDNATNVIDWYFQNKQPKNTEIF